MAVTLHAKKEKTGPNCCWGRGRPPWTHLQIRESLIDSQVLPVDHSNRCNPGAFVNECAFAIIASTELATPKDFISLKP